MKQPMTEQAARRIQSKTANMHSGIVPKGSFAARAMSAAMKNKVQVTAASKAPVPNGPSKTGNPSGGGRGNNPPRK